MYRFFLFLKKIGFVLLFVAIEGFALHYFVNSSSYNRGKMINVGNFLVGDIYAGINQIKHYFSLNRENRSLNEQIAALREEVQRLKAPEAVLPPGAPDSLAGPPRFGTVSQPDEIPYLFSTARVANNSIVLQKNFITLNKGLRDGVLPEMGLLAGGAVAGYVVNCSDRFSVAISILNTDFRTSGRIAGGDYTGSIFWDGLRTDEVVFSEVVKYAPLEVGDTIVTTDFSSFFPPDIPIGTVKSFELINGTYYQARLQLMAAMGSLNNVLLVDYRYRDEKLDLENETASRSGY
jgi:rod shape-determining protein MreC